MANTTLYGPDGTIVSVADTPATLKNRLLARGYTTTPQVVSSPGAATRQLSLGGNQGAVVFRWDDGYASALQLAQMASTRGQRHTFALTSDLIGQTNYLTTAGVTAIAKAGHEIACHSKTHVTMTGLTAATRVPQYDDSKTALQAIASVPPVTTWVYPLGGTARDATTDAELFLRYDRIMDTSGYTSRRWMFAADQRRSGQFSVASLNLDGTAKAQAVAKAAIELASRQPIIVSFYSHDLGSGGSVSLAQATDLMDYAQSLQVPCITAKEAWPGARLLRDGGFEAADLSNWEVVPTTTQTAAIATDAPVTGLPGTKSLKLTNAVVAETVYAEQEVAVVGGQSYTLSGRLRLSVTGDASNYIRYRISQREWTGSPTGTTPDNAPISINNGANVTATAWTKPAPLTVVTDPRTTFVRISVLLNGVVGDGYADHLHFGPTVEGSFG